VNFEASPHPTADEREAIAGAIGRLRGEDTVPAPYRSPWRVAALRENITPWAARPGAWAAALAPHPRG
jgi:hypothetical protein